MKNKIQNYEIDAKERILGRLATEVAVLLWGKNRPDFVPNKVPNTKVHVFNIAKIKVSGKKFEDKLYYSHSGYVGNLKVKNFKEIFEKDPCIVMRKAVLGMLPKNKLRKIMIKNLKLYEGEIN
ncbi:50S ribosomal protein L13 [bacterium]|nr:50S ribosomal protein L13 [bacterium]|tara:strand:- start:27898 stop:28266 length:369 start_codon:yes stop_codon:yes gene_type:complete